MTDDDCCDSSLLAGADDDGARRLGIAGFHALWRGERPPIGSLVDDPKVITAMTEAGRLEVTDDGGLLAVHGLVARPTRHRIRHAEGIVHTWCAFDAIGIPAALGVDATAETSCPTCERPLTVAIHAGEVAAAEDLRLWLPATQCTHLVEDFCAHANLYCDTDHLAASVRPGSTGETLTVAEAADLGRRTWRDVAPEPTN